MRSNSSESDVGVSGSKATWKLPWEVRGPAQATPLLFWTLPGFLPQSPQCPVLAFRALLARDWGNCPPRDPSLQGTLPGVCPGATQPICPTPEARLCCCLPGEEWTPPPPRFRKGDQPLLP